MLSWFDAREHRRFGEQLAALVVEKMPLERPAKQALSPRKRPKKPQEVLRKLLAQIAEFSAKHRANFYQRAKFANAFKWKLLEAGYDAEFADELAKELLIHFR
ncbi:MAG: hypothetical protein U1F25_21125 [Rubrivivax sp.]